MPLNTRNLHPLLRWGSLCLALSLVLRLFFPVQSNAVHFIAGVLLGMSLVFMMRGLYLTRTGKTGVCG